MRRENTGVGPYRITSGGGDRQGRLDPEGLGPVRDTVDMRPNRAGVSAELIEPDGDQGDDNNRHAEAHALVNHVGSRVSFAARNLVMRAMASHGDLQTRLNP